MDTSETISQFFMHENRVKITIKTFYHKKIHQILIILSKGSNFLTYWKKNNSINHWSIFTNFRNSESENWSSKASLSWKSISSCNLLISRKKSIASYPFFRSKEAIYMDMLKLFN